MFCVSNSFVQKTLSQIGRLLFMLQSFSSSCTKKWESVSLLLLRATSCFQPWEQILSINENMKNSLEIKFWKKNIFTLPGLESEILQELRLRPSIHTTCQNLNWKKNASDYCFWIQFFSACQVFICLFI